MSATVDASKLDRDLRQLAKGLERAADDTARQTAEATARDIAGRVPVRTGALRATVGTVKVGDGYGVTYGGGLRYAWPVESRFRPVNSTLPDAERRYTDAARQAADSEVNRL